MREQSGANASHSYVGRIIGVLTLFAESTGELTLGEVSSALSVPQSSAHRLLVPLVEMGLIERAPRRRYRIGTEFCRIAILVEERFGLLSLAKPLIAETAEKCGETCLLGVLTPPRNRIVLAHKEDTKLPLRFSFDVLTNITPAWGSLGRAIMAWLGPTDLRRVIAEAGPSPLTGERLPDMATLEEELETIRQTGFARSKGQRAAPDAIGISSPIFDCDGRICAALGVVAPEHRTTPEQEETIARLVTKAATRISRGLGYRAKSKRLRENAA